MKHLLLATFFLLTVGGYAQHPLTWDDFVAELTEDEYAEEQGWMEHLEDLADIYAHPIDVNSATHTDLQQLPFLDSQQIEDIIQYVFRYGGMRSISELMAIESIDYMTRRYLSIFLYASPLKNEWKDTLSFRRLMQQSKHQITTRFDIPLYYRKGYCVSPSEGGYLGNPMSQRFQYKLTSMRHLQVGVLAKKDAGEPFKNNKGWDSYGGHVSLTNIKHLQTLILGDYRVNFGQGLVLNNGLTLGKQQLSKTANSLRPRTAYDEYRFLRGIASSWRMKHGLSATAFVSVRQHDATLNSDGSVATILTSGLHRTNTEMQKKYNFVATLAGANLAWNYKSLQLGLTGYWQHMSRTLSPGSQTYRRYYPQGQNFGVMGIYYGYAQHWFSLHGETAYSTNHQGIATLNRIGIPIVDDWKITIVQRYYSKEYYSFHASALSDNTRIQNENGVLLRVDGRPLPGLTLTAYADFFRNPWPRYGFTHSTMGQEAVMQAAYDLSRNSNLSVRYQWKHKEQTDGLYATNRLRISYNQTIAEHWQLKSLGQLTALQHDCGLGLSEVVRYEQTSWRLQASMTYFHTPDYQHRIYFYEPSVSSTFYMPALFGHGMRGTLAGGCSLWQQRLHLEAKVGTSLFFDRTEQGTGMQAISSRWKTDLQFALQVRL